MSGSIKPQKIFVSIDDSVPYVLDLIGNVLTSRIILVIEENAGIISSPVSLKVLMRELAKSNRVVILQTRDKKARKFGEIVGFVVVEETSEISDGFWKDSEQGVDAFKNIYAERKSILNNRRKELSSNILTSISPRNTKTSLKIEKENIENEPELNADEVIDFPLVENVKLNKSEIEVEEKELDEETQSSEIEIESLVEEIMPEEVIDPVTLAREAASRKLHSELKPQKLFVPEPAPIEEIVIDEEEFTEKKAKDLRNKKVKNIVEVESPKVNRLSFEELYKQAKQKYSEKRKVEKVDEVDSVSFPVNSTFSEPEIPPPPIYKRYVPKLIRTSGLVIAPGGDLTNFEEINNEIVKDELSILDEKKYQADTEKRKQQEITQTKFENFKTSEPVSVPKVRERSTAPVKVRNDIPSNNVFSFLKYPSIDKISGLIVNAKKSSVQFGNVLKKTFSKMKTLSQTPENRPSRYQSARQHIPGDPLKKKSNYTPPPSRLLNRKLVKNTVRSVVIFLIFFGASTFLFLRYGTRAEVTFALTPIAISATKDITLQTNLASTTGENTSNVLGTQDGIQLESLSYSLDLGQSIPTTTTIDQGKEATGSLTVYNKTDKDIPLTAGTKFNIEIAKKKLSYQLVGNVTIPKRVIKTIRTDNGFVDVRAVADGKGADYNVPAELLGEQNRFTISGFESSTIEGISYGGFVGGTTKVVKIVSQADHDTLKSTLVSKLQDQITSYLQSKYSVDYDIVSKDTKFEIQKEEYNGDIGQPADKVDLYMKIEGKISGVKKKSIESTINTFYEQVKTEKLSGKVGEYVFPVNEKWDHKYTIVSSNDTNVVVKLEIKGNILPPVDLKTIKSQLIGLKYSEASKIFTNYKDITENSLTISPDFIPQSLRYFPQNVDAINIVFEKVEL